MTQIPDDIWEAARSLRNAVVWQSNASIEIIAKALLTQRKAAEAERDRLREALEETEETLRLVEHPAFKDPVHGDEVEALGNRIGYGALMSSASASWRERLARNGGLVGGEFVAGPCHVSVVRTLAIVRAALQKEPQP